MEVKYEKILEHYVLKEGDTLCLHGIQYHVESLGARFFLNNLKGSNSAVFRVLGIKNKVGFCEDTAKVKTYGGDFPEVETLSDLTAVVKALYERSPYKVGDKVKLKDDVHGCPWVVVPMMEKDAGKVVTIKDIRLRCHSGSLDGDPHEYRFKEILCTWSPQTIDHKVEDADVAEETMDEVCQPVEKSTIEHGDDYHRSCASSSSDTDVKSSVDCRLMEESIIIQKPKSKIKTTIKL